MEIFVRLFVFFMQHVQNDSIVPVTSPCYLLRVLNRLTSSANVNVPLNKLAESQFIKPRIRLLSMDDSFICFAPEPPPEIFQ